MSRVAAHDVARALQEVVDPELGIDVVALGLVYGIQTDGERVRVQLSLTSSGCPMALTMVEAAEVIVAGELGVDRVEVELVTEPPWEVEMLSAEARVVLGLPPAG